MSGTTVGIRPWTSRGVDPRAGDGARRAVVTGGAGFIGSHLCEALIRFGFEVECLDNFSTGSPENVAGLANTATFRLIECDVMQGVPVSEKADLVIHCGWPLESSADLAQAAADVAIQKWGTSVCSTEELERRLGRAADPVLEPAELLRQLAQARQEGRRIVFTNGCFDVLHRGHTSYLRQAKALGDVLVVALNDDESVRRLKGPSRPINAASDRASVLAALSCVDYVTVFESDTPIPLIQQMRPDVYAKGGDYTPEMLEETAVVAAYGGEVAILDYVPSQSTTAVVNRIRSSEPIVADQSGPR